MKRVLVISYAFPPWACAGVHRPLRFVKNLPHHGWTPVILTARGNLDAARDERLYGEIPPGVDICSAWGVNPHGWIMSALDFLRGRRERPPEASGPRKPAGAGAPVAASPPGPFRRLKDMGLAAFSTPDRRLFWVPSAVAAGARLLRRHPVDAILVTTPPHSVQFVGFALSAMFRIPWVADLRDAWVDNPHLLLRRRTRIRLRVESAMEAFVVSRADRVLMVSPFWRDRLAARYPERSDGIRLLPNGYDRDTFAHSADIAANGAFTLAHLGSLYYGRKAEEVLQGVRLWIDRAGGGEAANLRLFLAGSKIPSLAPRVAALGLDRHVELHDLLPHGEAVQRMRQSSALLLVSDFAPGSEGMVPCKLFEYLASGRPVLAIAPEGDATRLVREARAGVVVTDPDPAAIAEGIERVRLAANAGWVPPDPDLVASYEGRRLTGDLARILDEVAGSRRRSPALSSRSISSVP
ncbi:MAG: glycosyltransferase [Planctomycetes bacterium]|nr:glycosyltransferase [Planctomycetota bacterium]